MLRTKQTGEPKLSILKNSITEELIMLEGIKSPVSKKSPIAELKIEFRGILNHLEEGRALCQ